MARIDYDGPVSAAYEAGRGAPVGGLDGWRDALTAYLPTRLPLLDLGAGTGLYSRLIHGWFDHEHGSSWVLADTSSAAPPLPGRNQLRFTPGSGLEQED